MVFAAAGTLDLNGQQTSSATWCSAAPAPASAALARTNGALYNSNQAPASTSANYTLTLGTSGATISGLGNITINGVVQDGPVAGTTLTTNGPDTLLLTNNGNTFTGPVAVAGGVLQLGAPGAGPASGNTVTVTHRRHVGPQRPERHVPAGR